MNRTQVCDVCGYIYTTLLCPHCYIGKKKKSNIKIPLKNGQIDTKTLADIMTTKILVKLETSYPYSVKRSIESDIQEILDYIIDNA